MLTRFSTLCCQQLWNSYFLKMYKQMCSKKPITNEGMNQSFHLVFMPWQPNVDDPKKGRQYSILVLIFHKNLVKLKFHAIKMLLQKGVHPIVDRLKPVQTWKSQIWWWCQWWIWHGLANHWAPNVQMTAFIYSPVNQLSHNYNKGSLLASLLGLAKVIHSKYYRHFKKSCFAKSFGQIKNGLVSGN